jgi:SAM-dependent methyltransferase
MERPFYGRFAWAYDLIIPAPVAKRCDFIETTLVDRGVPTGSRILDAGCGTGDYSIGLARRGYAVTGLDISTGLVSIAIEKLCDTSLPIEFLIGDILELPREPRFDGILCRGVLNGITGDEDRQRILRSFAGALRKGGVLVLDVREWNATALRKRETPIFEKTVETSRGRLTFRSATRLDNATRCLHVSERHTLERHGGEEVSEYGFVMRCWTQEELHTSLSDAGFGSTAYFGDYDSHARAGSTDRIVAVCSLK